MILKDFQDLNINLHTKLHTDPGISKIAEKLENNDARESILRRFQKKVIQLLVSKINLIIDFKGFGDF